MVRAAKFVCKHAIGPVLGITSSDARWGIFGIALSSAVSWGAFALSFYQMGSEGRPTMTPTAWLFIALAAMSFSFAAIIGSYWFFHPSDTGSKVLKSLERIEEAINDLAKAIRQDRNGTNGKPER